MDKFYKERLSKLELEISELEVEVDCSLQRIEAAIHLILECLSELKEYVLKKDLRILMKKSAFSNIRNLLLFQSSSTTTPFIK